MKKGFIVLLALAFVMAGSTCAFASSVGEQAPIPVWLNAPAIAETGVDFSITDKVPGSVTPGSSVLSFPNVTVTNNAATGQLKIEQVEAKAVNGWSLKLDKASYFNNLKADTKELSLVADNTHDFALNSVYVLGDTKLVSPGKSASVSLSGHVGTFTTAMKCIVANIIPTIAIY